jgi:periplasmic mercuric ion binding protein
MKKIFTLFLGILFVANFAFAANMKEAKIKTNAQCKDCKAKIEKSLKDIKGVKSATVNLKSKIVLVKYDADLTDEKALEATVNSSCSATKDAKCDAKCKDAKCCDKDKKADGTTCDPKKCTGKK